MTDGGGTRKKPASGSGSSSVTPEPTATTPGPTPNGPAPMPAPTPEPTPVPTPAPIPHDCTKNTSSSNTNYLGAGVVTLVGVGVSCLDGPLPIADALVFTGLAYFSTRAESKAMEKAQEIAEEKEWDNRAIFTVNPYDFHPNGLELIPHPGTKNGPLIDWRDPLTNTTIFRWDANINYDNGPHYHIIAMGETHFYAPSEVPEPWASLFFGGE